MAWPVAPAGAAASATERSVSEISPGRVETGAHLGLTEDREEGRRRFYEGFETLQPGDIAEAVMFVLGAPPPKKFTKQIAFNVIPHIDVFLEDGSTKEEWKMTAETQKILDPNIQLTATAVRVPVFVGHSEAVNIEFENELSAEDAQKILREAPGIMLVDKRENGGYVTPVECVGDYATFVSRVRKDPTVEHGLALWCVSDNLRKGAALNAVQIAELLGRRHLKKG